MRDLLGRPYQTRATPMKLDIGVNVDMENSLQMDQEAEKEFLNMLHSLVPWTRDANIAPKTKWRSILLIIIFFLRTIVDGELSDTWNKHYHATSIPENEVRIVSNDTSVNIINEFNLSFGQRYWIQQRELMIVNTGDGHQCSNLPDDVSGITCGITKIHAFEHECLQQTLYIGIPFMISGLSEHDPRIARVYHMCSQEVGLNGSLSFRSVTRNCMICCRYFRYDNGDWPFLSQVILRCMGHSGTYPFIYWIHYIGTEYVPVSKFHDSWFGAIKAGIKDEHMPWNLNLNDLTPSSNFYCLATAWHWNQWANELEEYMNTLEKLSNFKKKNHKQKHKKRLEYARKNAMNVLYKTPTALLRYILDVMHCILRHSITMISGLVIFCFCVARLSLNQVIAIVACTCMLRII